MGGQHHGHHSSTRNIRTAFFLNVGFTLLEIAAGIYTNSVAILSDAIHDLGDSLSLGMSWYLQDRSGRKASGAFSYGYRRLSLLAALINSMVLIVGSVFVMSEAVTRLMNPEQSNADGMILFAILGIAVNGYAAWKMSTGKSLNERVVIWHLMEDVLGWVAILAVAIVLKFWNNLYLDPFLSLLITAYILFNVFKRLRETLLLFLQVVPGDLDENAVEEAILGVEKVSSVHHMHLWSLDGEHHVFTAHICLDGVKSLEELAQAKLEIVQALSVWTFEHWTIQTEVNGEACLLSPQDH